MLLFIQTVATFFVLTYMFIYCKTKKEIPLEPSKGKKASVNPKNTKVSEEPKTEKPVESSDPAEIKPG